MKYCIYCGAEIRETSMFCGMCGKPVRSNVDLNGIEENHKYYESELNERESFYDSKELFKDPYQIKDDTTHAPAFDFSQFTNSMKDMTAKAAVTASKAATQAKTVASQTKKRIDNNIEEGVGKEIEKVNEDRQKKEGLVSNEYSGANYMSSTELWTWLKKDSKRQQFFTDEISQETEAEYIEELTQKLIGNHIPARIEKRYISWDRSNAKEELYVAIPETKVVNPLTYLIQFSHVGKFTFVEEKTFITPPDLPEVPHNKIQNNALKGAASLYLLVAGIGCLLLPSMVDMRGNGPVFFWFLSIVFFIIAIYNIYRIQKVIEYNSKCDEELKKWNDAWENWRNSIFLHSFQEDVNGQLSRIFDSVFSCINQINEEKFKGMKTLEVEDSSDMNELEQMISRKQAEYR